MPIRRNAIAALQDFGARRRHDDGPVGPGDQALQHGFLLLARLFQHGVQRQDQRQVGGADQLQNVGARRAAENAEFMLQPDRFGAARFDPFGGGAVIVEHLGIDRADQPGINDARSVIHRIMIDRHAG